MERITGHLPRETLDLTDRDTQAVDSALRRFLLIRDQGAHTVCTAGHATMTAEV